MSASRRIAQVFAQLVSEKRKALIPYVTAGDPDLKASLQVLHTLVEAGADIIELGIPFSDPASDGPVIQQAAERALASGTTLPGVLELVIQFRKTNTKTPIVLMGYLNPIEAMGHESFAKQVEQAGVDGVLIVDLPPEANDGLILALQSREIDTIFLAAPTTSAKRIERVCQKSSGYLYYVSLKGVTGASHIDVQDVERQVARLRETASTPIAVGFGIHDAASACQLAACADGVIIGSALVKQLIGYHEHPQKTLDGIKNWLSEIRQALDSATAAG